MEKRVKRNPLARVKEVTDKIYETIVAQPSGTYSGGFSHLGHYYSLVLKELVDRRIVARERNLAAPRLAYKYTWAAAMAPTNTLYKNIAFSIWAKKKQIKDASRAKKKSGEPTSAEPATLDVEVVKYELLEQERERNPLSAFSDVELWSELKARGFEIIDGRLARFLD